jgi:hypothetical protein
MALVGRPIACGILPSEIVLRGGGLDKPVVLTELKEESGKRFFHLVKANEIVSMFLTGSCKSRCLLANSLTIEHVGSLRDDKFAELAAELGGDASVELAASVDDGLDLVPAVIGTPSPRKARVRPQILIQMPSFAAVEVLMPDDTMWRPVVLLADRKSNPFIEATEQNFQNLYILVQHDLAGGQQKRLGHGLGRGVDEKKEPRALDNGSTEYWVENRQRWCQKKALDQDALKDEQPNKRMKYKSLYRVPSDEAAMYGRGRARGRGRGRGRKAVANEPPLPIHGGSPEAVDSLGLDC